MKKNIIVVIIILVAFAIIAFTLMKNQKENQQKTDIVAQKNANVAVKIDTVKTEVVSLNFTANGYFEPIQELTYSAEKSGKVVNVLVKEGDRVAIGQTLAIVRSDVVNVNAQTANALYQTALTDYTRFENAFKTGGVTQQQLDQARLAMVNAKNNLTQANINVGDTKIKAPINGIINKKYIEPGSILAGTPPTSMFHIVDVSKLKLKVSVNENQVVSLKLGDNIKIEASVFSDKEFTGKITFIAPKSDSSLNFPVKIEIINNSINDLRAGMYGTATFHSSNQQNQSILVVPRTAFVGSVSSNQVFVVENETAKLKTVSAGRILGDKVEILSGLINNDIVIVTGQINLQEGSKIEIIK